MWDERITRLSLDFIYGLVLKGELEGYQKITKFLCIAKDLMTRFPSASYHTLHDTGKIALHFLHDRYLPPLSIRFCVYD